MPIRNSLSARPNPRPSPQSSQAQALTDRSGDGNYFKLIHAQDVAGDVVRPAVEDVKISSVLVRARGEVLFELPKRMPVRFSFYDVAGKAVLELKGPFMNPADTG